MKIRHILCTAIMALIAFSCSNGNGETNQVGTRKAIIDTSDIIRKSDLENNKLRKDFASFESNALKDYHDPNCETTTSLKPQEPAIYSTVERCHIATFPVATLLPHLLNPENAFLALKCTFNPTDREHPDIQTLHIPLSKEGFPRRLLEDYQNCYDGNFSSLNEFFFRWPSCNK